ncbi:MAG: PHP domain-containing protein [Anaerolineae bacterium]|nr:PHP domain-containing protein [Anaerolineae bacterium]
MTLYEYAGNLHVHTRYSDGAAYHARIADDALLAGLDFVVFTDHNLWVPGVEGYYGDPDRGYVLLLAGEEVHDRSRIPPGNHVLVYGAEQEVSQHAHTLPGLIKAVNQAGGMSFIAHPDDHAVAWMGESAFPWADRHIEGFTGLEIWNYMSRFKDHIQTRRQTLRSIFNPEDIMLGPNPRTLMLWDQLLGMGQDIVGIGSADAHGTQYRLGPISHTVFPYDFLFSCVNTHILTKFALTGELQHDKEVLYTGLRQGRVFIGYDLPARTKGFRYTAQGQNTSAVMGGHIRLGHGVTLQALAPTRARIRIICGGDVVAEERRVENLTHVVRKPGAYRAEVWLPYRDRERMWIISNPIYVDPNPSSLRR